MTKEEALGPAAPKAAQTGSSRVKHRDGDTTRSRHLGSPAARGHISAPSPGHPPAMGGGQVTVAPARLS